MTKDKVYNIESVIKAFEELRYDKSTEQQMTIEFREKRYNVIVSLSNPMYKHYDFKLNHRFYTVKETSRIKPSEYILVSTPKKPILVYNVSAKPVNNEAISWSDECDLKNIITERCDVECVDGDIFNMRVMCKQDYDQNFESAEEFLKKKHKKKCENYITQQNRNKLIDTLIKPGLKEAFDQISLWYSENDDKLYFRGNVLQEKIEKLLMEEMQPILKQYNISFKSNLKGLSIVRTLGTIKFNKDM